MGAAQYLAVSTRPDIADTCSQLAKYIQNPGPDHWKAVTHLYQYLKGTCDLKLHLGGTAERTVGYSDADGMSTEGRKAISSYVYLINDGTVSWSSKQQNLVTLSTTESEYVGLTHATKEAIWICSFLMEVLGIPDDPLLLYSDNQSAIALAKDDQFHAHTKHIDIRFHFIRYAIAEGKIQLEYCPTEDMVADILTKALPSMKVKHFASSMGLA